MVSLDDAVLARFEYGGTRFELLVDPVLVDAWLEDHAAVELDDLLASDEVWTDARAGDRPTREDLEAAFGSNQLIPAAERILRDGDIQLTTEQRRHRVEQMRRAIITEIHRTAVDPKTKLPHPEQRLELALEESRYPVDPFKPAHQQVKEAVKRLRPLIPLSFETVRLALKVPGKDYGSVHQLVRPDVKREEWLENGTWVCVIEIPAGMKGEMISQVANRAHEVEVKEL